jgi:Class III cytochrome C family
LFLRCDWLVDIHIKELLRVGRLFLGLLAVLLCGSAMAQTAPTAPIVLKDGATGAVKFDHTSHLKVAGKCGVCHHASKALKPLKSPQEPCTDCHTNPATPPVTTKLLAAFHNPTATSGLCIDCHRTEDANGKAAPVKCAECHKKNAD